jgi:hypothetical protein
LHWNPPTAVWRVVMAPQAWQRMQSAVLVAQAPVGMADANEVWHSRQAMPR